MQKRRRAYEERQCGGRYGSELAECFAGPLERDVASLMTLPGTPDVGAGGEVVNTHPAPDGMAVTPSPSAEAIRFTARNTLAEGATRIAEDASIRRQDLLLQPSFNALALAIDAAQSIDAANSLERMRTHQMAVAHDMALRLASRALSSDHSRAGDQVEACAGCQTPWRG
jgi:hypothetical protein